MKIKATANATALGMSDTVKLNRMDRAGAAGVLLTALGLTLTAISYATYMHNTMWVGTYEGDYDGRTAIQKAYEETENKLMEK